MIHVLIRATNYGVAARCGWSATLLTCNPLRVLALPPSIAIIVFIIWDRFVNDAMRWPAIINTKLTWWLWWFAQFAVNNHMLLMRLASRVLLDCFYRRNWNLLYYKFLFRSFETNVTWMVTRENKLIEMSKCFNLSSFLSVSLWSRCFCSGEKLKTVWLIYDKHLILCGNG